jgi:hypothetical protein
MDNFFRSGLILIAGIGLLALAGAIHAILLEGTLWTLLIGIAGIVLTVWGGYALRAEFAPWCRQRRGKSPSVRWGGRRAHAVPAVGQFRPPRHDRRASVRSRPRPSPSSDKPVHIVFFHDPLMCETV